tara:strand:- start:2688 stop:3071 length:384 start_codon:yes stop_codon:yes gene_type:complete
MSIEYIRRTPTTNQEYYNKQLEQAVNELVNRVNINYKKLTASSYGAKVDDLFIDVNVSQATTINLPVNAPIGTNYIIKDTSGNASTNNITVTSGSGDTIEGANTKVISTNYGLVKLIYNGTNKWLTI